MGSAPEPPISTLISQYSFDHLRTAANGVPTTLMACDKDVSLHRPNSLV